MSCAFVIISGTCCVAARKRETQKIYFLKAPAAIVTEREYLYRKENVQAAVLALVLTMVGCRLNLDGTIGGRIYYPSNVTYYEPFLFLSCIRLFVCWPGTFAAGCCVYIPSTFIYLFV